MKQNKAIIVMDYINEIVHPDGKFKGKGYADFCKENNVIENVVDAVANMRESGGYVIYVKISFEENYSDLPKNSVLFEKAPIFNALQKNTWATEFHESLDVRVSDFVAIKNRISPFSNPQLEDFLKSNNITDLYLAGVATDLVVQSAARDAHDKDYSVCVLSDCCGAGNMVDHKAALNNLEKFVRVSTYKNLF